MEAVDVDRGLRQWHRVHAEADGGYQGCGLWREIYCNYGRSVQERPLSREQSWTITVRMARQSGWRRQQVELRFYQIGHEASTIHRLLNSFGAWIWLYEANPIDADLFIFDEMSMVDLPLMRHLLRAIPDHATVVLVGMTLQIPSVGAGNVLADIINSGVVPVYFLDVIFRQRR